MGIKKFIKNNRCEICKSPILTDIHHIQSKSANGTNKSYNKSELCPNCHRQVHEGKIILEGRFFTTNCKLGETELIWRHNDTNSITNNNEPEVYKIFKN